MNAVEIEAAVSDLAAEPFDAAEFPFQFLQAFDKKETTLKRLRKGDSNKSDVPGGVLLQANIHMAVCPLSQTRATLERLKASPKTVAGKAKFVLATDGVVLEAEDLLSGESIAPDYPRFAEHIGFFLPLAGISTVREIKDNPIDVRATGRLNKLYVELLRQNPEWGTDARRHDMNHFMARLIFCFFAEDTDIFHSRGLFTSTVEQWSESDGSTTHTVLEACFRAMNTKSVERAAAGIPNYANIFPYVNGGLFAGSTEVPRFTRIARSYLLQAGALDWQHINPDIFGSMIQAVADEAERGALGMHYTSVPNIMKVLKPLFLDELCATLEAAGDNSRTLLNLRKRLSRIRVFDPACGSGNFLVIAYKELRKIEAEINQRRSEELRPSDISEKNFRGIEIRDFAVEIARLSLVISKFQADVLHRGPLVARAEFLPLKDDNWIVCGNALRLDWLKVCPPEGTGVKLVEDDLFQTPLDQPEIDFENEGGETFICGNPPYVGSVVQGLDQKSDLKESYYAAGKGWKSLDYVAGWFLKASAYCQRNPCRFAFVATNSICQGEQVPILWPPILAFGLSIHFAISSFKWSNLAANKAGVTVIVVGIGKTREQDSFFWEISNDNELVRKVANISPYLIPGPNIIVYQRTEPLSARAVMIRGNTANDGGNLILTSLERQKLIAAAPGAQRFIRPLLGSKELIASTKKFCLWISDSELYLAAAIPEIRQRFDLVTSVRSKGGSQAKEYSDKPHRFVRTPHQEVSAIVVPRVSSENRDFLPVDLSEGSVVVSDRNFVMYHAPLWNMALIASRLHWVWIGTICVRLEMRFSYSNTLGWNTFPVPTLTEQNKADLTRSAEDILLAREAHFPATIADLYDPEAMPANLRAAHEANDETLERIYIGRRFKNDTERLETLFAMYAKMTEKPAAGTKVQGINKKPRAKRTLEVQA